MAYALPYSTANVAFKLYNRGFKIQLTDPDGELICRPDNALFLPTGIK